MTREPSADSRAASAAEATRAAAHRRRRTVWTVGTPVVAVLCGSLFVASAQSSEGTDLRPGRYTDLASLVSDEASEVEDLQAEAAQLDEDVDVLTTAARSKRADRLQNRVAKVAAAAGREPVDGPGITVTLADAPESVIDASTRDINDHVVHQQDIQAVVNAMWAAGAEAVMVQGQRLITTTGIKCSGNAVRLHGIPYAQPYVIQAVGDTDALYSGIMANQTIGYYRQAAARPDIAVGWDLELDETLHAPAYEAPIELGYATPLTD